MNFAIHLYIMQCQFFPLLNIEVKFIHYIILISSIQQNNLIFVYTKNNHHNKSSYHPSPYN